MSSHMVHNHAKPSCKLMVCEHDSVKHYILAIRLPTTLCLLPQHFQLSDIRSYSFRSQSWCKTRIIRSTVCCSNEINCNSRRTVYLCTRSLFLLENIYKMQAKDFVCSLVCHFEPSTSFVCRSWPLLIQLSNAWLRPLCHCFRIKRRVHIRDDFDGFSCKL